MSDIFRLTSYGKVYNIGHAAIKDLFKGPVNIEEKVDGSQFSWALLDGKLHARSRNQELDVESNTQKMFDSAIESIKERQDLFRPYTIYRGEYLARPKHNTLCYDRVPRGHIAIWDIERAPGTQSYYTYDEKLEEAERLGLDCVPLLARGVTIASADELRKFLEVDSLLGGQKIEGVVVKNYAEFGRDSKVLRGKYVCEKFKEHNRKDWKDRHPSKNDAVTKIVERYRCVPRWEKAVQHLREAGELENSPKDIPKLLRELNSDFSEECLEEAQKLLWNSVKKDVYKGIGKGMAEWYKQKLLESAFDA